MIKAILFDAAGTLIYLPRSVAWHYREVAARHGVSVQEDIVTREFARAFKNAGARPATPGVPRPDDDKSWWRQIVQQVMKGSASPGADPWTARGFDTFFEDLYQHFAQPGVWELYPDVIAVLEHLRPRYKLGILSNFDRRLYPILENLRVRHFFDTITLSSEAGIDKPDPAIFHLALRTLGVTPAQAIMVGDHPDQDWRAAESAGLQVVPVTAGVKLADVRAF